MIEVRNKWNGGIDRDKQKHVIVIGARGNFSPLP
jgi:hypothetical protein